MTMVPKVWRKYARRPVDTETVRLEFFRKVRSGKLFQRSRAKRSPLDNCVKVPQYVKDHYCRPLPGYAADAAITPMQPASNKVARWLQPDFKIVCVWPFGLLDYGSASLRCKI